MDHLTKGASAALASALNSSDKQMAEDSTGNSVLINAHFSWGEFLETIKAFGYQVVFERQFDYLTEGQILRPAQIVAAHKENKLLLQATSKIVLGVLEVVNSATVHGTVLTNAPVTQARVDAFHRCSRSPIIQGEPVEFSMDIRDGQLSHLEEISRQWQFVDWENADEFLWLFNYWQKGNSSKNGKQKRDEVLTQLPAWVTEFIGV